MGRFPVEIAGVAVAVWRPAVAAAAAVVVEVTSCWCCLEDHQLRLKIPRTANVVAVAVVAAAGQKMLNRKAVFPNCWRFSS